MAIATLTFDLIANSAQLRKHLGEANKSLAKFGRDARKYANVAGTALAGATAVAGGALFALNKKYAATIDEVGKLSDSLGISTEKLTQYRHAASIAGLGQAEFDKSIEKMVRNLGEAEKGFGLSVRELERLNLNTNAFFRLKPGEQFEQIAERVSRLGSAQQKASLAANIFGRNGIRLVNTLNLGKDGLKAAADEADRLGITLNRIDVKLVEEANDSMTRLKSAISAFGQSFTVALAPIIQKITVMITNWIIKMGGLGQVGIKVVDSLVVGFGFVGEAIRGIRLAFDAVVLGFKGFNAAFFALAKFIVDGAVVLRQRLLDNLLYPFRKILEVLAPFSDTAKKALSDLEGIGQIKIADSFGDFVDSQIESLAIAKEEFTKDLFAPSVISSFKEFVATARAEALANANEIINAPPPETLDAPDDGGDLLKKKKKQQDEYFRFFRESKFREIKFDKLTTETKKRIATASGRDLLGGLAQTNKKAFKLNKIVGIADALISTYRGIAAGVKLGWPLAIPAVAYATATGFAAVKAIKSQQFSGGGASASGGGSAGSADFSSSVGSPAPGVFAGDLPSPDGDGGGGKVVTIDMRGGTASDRSFIRDLVAGLEEEIKDNGGRIGTLRLAEA